MHEYTLMYNWPTINNDSCFSKLISRETFKLKQDIMRYANVDVANAIKASEMDPLRKRISNAQPYDS